MANTSQSTIGAEKTPVKLPFLKGRVFELIICIAGLAVIVAVGSQVPLNDTASVNQATSLMFTALGVVMIVSMLMMRHGVLAAIRRDTRNPHHGNFIYRWLFFWFFIPSVIIVLLPWVVTGVFSDNDLNAVGVVGLLLLLLPLAILCGVVLAAVAVYPLEIFIRGIVQLIRTKGKEGIGNVGIGAYLLIVVAFIICGSLAVAANLPGQAGHGALIAALLGLPGGYKIKDPAFLWPTRILGIFIIGIPLAQAVVRKKWQKNRATEKVHTKKY